MYTNLTSLAQCLVDSAIVCTENPIGVDLVTELPIVNNNGHAIFRLF
jgi:hypothetical protein